MHPLAVVASVGGLGAFAFGQPLLDLLGRNPEFFIARRFPTLDLAILTLALLALPLVLAVPVLLVRMVSPASAGVLHLVVLAALGSTVAATIFATVGLGEWTTARYIGVAIWCGVVVAYLYSSFSPVRVGFSYLGLAPIVFGLWFAFATPTSQLWLGSPADVPEAGPIGDPAPVVMVVYDEFPLASMIRPDGSLDAANFPAFSQLASDGVWYRNAVGVRQQTEEALPAILTGRAVSEGSIPTTVDHPFSLFTLLSGDYDVAAVENVTELCPGFVCSNESRPVQPVVDRWQSLLDDLGVVYGHIVLPDSMASRLPPVDHGWVGFDEVTPDQFDIIERFNAELTEDRRRELERFLGTFQGLGSRPPLRFAHFLYPHHPWNLTSDGRLYGAPRSPGRDGVGWGPDPFLVAQGWQRHLIQSHYADTMLGRVIDEMEEAGIYDDALLIVVADHGITVRPNTDHQRIITPETVGTIAYVPLFVKYPEGVDGVQPGTIDDARAETVDIVPTVTDVVDTQLPWAVDGLSLLDVPARAERSGSVMLGTNGEVDIPPGTDALLDVAGVQEGLFPGGDPYRLTPPGWGTLLGRDGVTGPDADDVLLTIDQAGAIADYVPGSDPVPAYVSGALSGGASRGDAVVAVTVDGRVEAVTRTYDSGDSGILWDAMIPPEALDTGGRDVVAWLVTGTADDPAFRR